MCSKILLAAFIAACGLAASPAWAERSTCIGYVDEYDVDDLVVPPGERCVLDGTEVRGNVRVEEGAALEVRGAHIAGNLQANGAERLELTADSTVRGNVQVRRTREVRLTESRIGGNLQLDGNRGEMRVGRNAIAGNLQAVGNRGPLSIGQNRIGGNLQCEGNRPAPDAHRNRVRGQTAGQCDDFEG